MSRILVTGADGFTGRHLCEALDQAGHEVCKLSADLLDRAALERTVAEVQPERVAHLAAISFVAHGDVEAIYRVNIVGTRNLLAALAELSQKPAGVMLVSSANIYGNAPEGLIDESVSPAPANDYAVSKFAMEAMAHLWQSQLPLTVVRPFNYIGRGQSKDFVIAKIADHIRRRAPVIELGNLDVERDFSDVRRVVDAYLRLLSLDKPPTGPLNVCSGQGTSLREIIELACELGGHRPEIRVNPAFVRANEVRVLVGNPAALESCIGPLKTYSLRETMTWILSA
jgi:nucleoside-diphosphate-sugar epimerase